MTEKQIIAQRKRIQQRLAKAEADLLVLQHNCTHPNLTKKYGSNTGNYDPSADCYWINFHCPACDKRWVEWQ